MHPNPDIEMCAKEVPTNWLDPLLTGPDAVIKGPPYTGTDIERLLRAINERIRALPDKSGEVVAWMVTRDSLHEPAEFFSCEEDAFKNACLGLNKTHVVPLYAARSEEGKK